MSTLITFDTLFSLRDIEDFSDTLSFVDEPHLGNYFERRKPQSSNPLTPKISTPAPSDSYSYSFWVWVFVF